MIRSTQEGLNLVEFYEAFEQSISTNFNTFIFEENGPSKNEVMIILEMFIKYMNLTDSLLDLNIWKSASTGNRAWGGKELELVE